MNKTLKIAIKYALYYAPDFLKGWMKRLSHRVEIHQAKQRQKRTRVSKEEIHQIIEQLPLDCDVMLHTSKINIGYLEGGTAYIAEEIMNKVDLAHHTLLVSALPYRGTFYDYLKKEHVFDVRVAPIAMGAINKYIGSLPEAERSVHPTHSVVAIGKDAVYYTSEHALDQTPFGMHSPYYKLIRRGGMVLLFGATLNNLTCICAIEDLLGEPYARYIYAPKSYRVHCIDKEGNSLWVSTVCHDPKKALKRDLSFLHDDLIREGIMRVYPIGEAEVSLIDIRAFAIYYLQLLDKGISNRGKIKISPALHERIVETIQRIRELDKQEN